MMIHEGHHPFSTKNGIDPLAVGKNQSGVTNLVALLKFKVATSKVFTQLP